MPHNRFFSLNLNRETIEIADGEFHHLSHVMRVKEQETIELIDGQGGFAIGQVEKIERSKCKVKIIHFEQYPFQEAKLILAIAHPKLNHLEIALEKCTEIGVDEFVIFPTEQSEKFQLSESQKKRIDQLLISAIKQCGRFYLPKIQIIETIDDLKMYRCNKFFCHLNRDAQKVDAIKLSDHQNMVIIGPEKGFKEADITFIETELNATAIRLGPYIQRAETACISASACFVQKLNF